MENPFEPPAAATASAPNSARFQRRREWRLLIAICLSIVLAPVVGVAMAWVGAEIGGWRYHSNPEIWLEREPPGSPEYHAELQLVIHHAVKFGMIGMAAGFAIPWIWWAIKNASMQKIDSPSGISGRN